MSTSSHIGSGNWGIGREARAAAPAPAEVAALPSSAAVQHRPVAWNMVVLLAVLAVLILGLGLLVGGPQVNLVPAEPGADVSPVAGTEQPAIR